MQLDASFIATEAISMLARLQGAYRSNATAQPTSLSAPSQTHRRAFHLMYLLAILLHATFWIGWCLDLWRIGS